MKSFEVFSQWLNRHGEDIEEFLRTMKDAPDFMTKESNDTSVSLEIPVTVLKILQGSDDKSLRKLGKNIWTFVNLPVKETLSGVYTPEIEYYEYVSLKIRLFRNGLFVSEYYNICLEDYPGEEFDRIGDSLVLHTWVPFEEFK